jgi:putative flavoprotein involved in K+ transport
MERIDTVIVGAGQAGLATSYCLSQLGHEHLVLEQAARPAHVWHDERWDSFTLVTPNWALKLPGAEYNGPEPDGFMPRDDIVAYFDRYVEEFQLPVRYNIRVTAVAPQDGDGYRVTTPDQTIAADNVVIATGYEQHLRIPPAAANLSPAITQMHSSHYRNPQSLPDGAVLVVGTAQSGCQIAEELYQHGRQVFLSVGGAGRAPRRYRGRDIFEWLYRCGFFDITSDKLPMPRERFAAPHVSGTMGGHTLDLHQVARDAGTGSAREPGAGRPVRARSADDGRRLHSVAGQRRAGRYVAAAPRRLRAAARRGDRPRGGGRQHDHLGHGLRL